MNKRWEFLKSNRFWAAVIGALAIYLETKNLIGESERNFLATLVTVFIGLKTIDRTVDEATKK